MTFFMPAAPTPSVSLNGFGLDPLDLDPRLVEPLEPLLAAVRGAVVHLRDSGVDHQLRAHDGGLSGNEDDLLGIVRADLDQRVLLRVDAATTARLVRLAIVVREPLRGPVVSE